MLEEIAEFKFDLKTPAGALTRFTSGLEKMAMVKNFKEGFSFVVMWLVYNCTNFSGDQQ